MQLSKPIQNKIPEQTSSNLENEVNSNISNISNISNVGKDESVNNNTNNTNITDIVNNNIIPTKKSWLNILLTFAIVPLIAIFVPVVLLLLLSDGFSSIVLLTSWIKVATISSVALMIAYPILLLLGLPYFLYLQKNKKYSLFNSQLAGVLISLIFLMIFYKSVVQNLYLPFILMIILFPNITAFLIWLRLLKQK